MTSARAERKRDQERLRRDALKEAIEGLYHTLLQSDDDFCLEATRRSSIQGLRSLRTATSIANADEHLFFSRVEIVNQASHTLETIHTENQSLRRTINVASSAGHPREEDVSAKPRTVFHQGVGPVSSLGASATNQITQFHRLGGGQSPPNVLVVGDEGLESRTTDERHGPHSQKPTKRYSSEPNQQQKKVMLQEEKRESPTDRPLCRPSGQALKAELHQNQRAALLAQSISNSPPLVPASTAFLLSNTDSGNRLPGAMPLVATLPLPQHVMPIEWLPPRTPAFDLGLYTAFRQIITAQPSIMTATPTTTTGSLCRKRATPTVQDDGHQKRRKTE